MAELADAHGSGPCESNFMQVQVLLPAPRRSKVRFASIFLYKKVIRPLPCFSSFAKSHARLVCSVVNALATTRCRYQLFASFILTRYEHSHQEETTTFLRKLSFLFVLLSNVVLLCSDFFMRKSYQSSFNTALLSPLIINLTLLSSSNEQVQLS